MELPESGGGVLQSGVGGVGAVMVSMGGGSVFMAYWFLITGTLSLFEFPN